MSNKRKAITVIVVVAVLVLFLFTPVVYWGTISSPIATPNPPHWSVYKSLSCSVIPIGVYYSTGLGGYNFGCNFVLPQ